MLVEPGKVIRAKPTVSIQDLKYYGIYFTSICMWVLFFLATKSNNV